MMYRFVEVQTDKRLVTLTLNNPDKRNALSLDVMREITAALRAIGDSDALGVILAARGPVFSAGHNFADMAGATLEQTREVFGVCTEMMDTIQQIAQPVVARVHALATAGGCQLVASCDLAVASTTASFALPGGRAGLYCHTPLVAVARNVGRKRAMELAMTGDAISAETAAEWGLVNYAVPPDQLEAATLDLIQRATRGSAHSKALGKRAFYQQVDLPQPAAYAFAAERMATAAVSEDAQEGIAAFLEKRPANYR